MNFYKFTYFLVLQLLVKQPKKKHTMLKIKGPSVLNLITDPYIIIVVGA